MLNDALPDTPIEVHLDISADPVTDLIALFTSHWLYKRHM